MCLVFKATYIDRGKPLREDAFFFARTMLFSPLDKRNTRDKAKGLCITLERHIGELGVRYLALEIEDRTLSNSLLLYCSRHAPTYYQAKSPH